MQNLIEVLNDRIALADFTDGLVGAEKGLPASQH